MTRDRSIPDRREAIERRIDDVLGPAGPDGSTVPRATMDGFDDRWYGQLLWHSYDAVADSPDDGSVRSAAAAIELLRGYCRLRTELAGEVAAERAHPAAGGVTSPLLAGDYLYSAAYSTLGAGESPRLEACFGTLARVSETIIGAFGDRYVRSTSAIGDASFVDRTAGALGRGAAVVGATLAGADPSSRDRFAALGRGFGADRRLRPALEGGASPAPGVADREEEFRRRADRRRAEGVQALESLPSRIDASALRTFVGVPDDPADDRR